MAKDPRRDPAYVLQEDLIREFLPSIGREQWQVVYGSTDRTPDSFAVFSALVPLSDVRAILGHDSWDLSIGDGLPGFSQSSKGKQTTTTYHRFGGLGNVRPLVVYRQFHGAWPDYVQLREEFRHFHDLAEDRERGTFVTLDTSGYPVDVARLQFNRVEVRLPHLLQFLAATQLHLAIFFDIRRFSALPLDETPIAQRDLDHTDDRSRYVRHVRTWDYDPA